MANRSSELRRSIWYRRYKRLAETIQNKSLPDTLRCIHKFLDDNYGYGYATIAWSAKESVEQVITDLNLPDDGLAARLSKIKASAYNTEMPLTQIINQLDDNELQQVFDNLYEGLLQEGRIEAQPRLLPVG